MVIRILMSGRQFIPDFSGIWQNEFKFIILFWFLVNNCFGLIFSPEPDRVSSPAESGLYLCSRRNQFADFVLFSGFTSFLNIFINCPDLFVLI